MITPASALTLALVVMAFASAPVAVEAKPLAIELDPTATDVSFTLGATLHTVEGTLELERGSIVFNPPSGPIEGRIVVDATSADTGNDKRDRDMHRKVLLSAAHPRIVLTLEHVVGDVATAGRSTVTVAGSIELAGDSHPVEIPMEITIDGELVEAKASFEVPYVEWGLEDPSKFLLRVDKHVTVTIDTRGRISLSPASPAGDDGDRPSAD